MLKPTGAAVDCGEAKALDLTIENLTVKDDLQVLTLRNLRTVS